MACDIYGYPIPEKQELKVFVFCCEHGECVIHAKDIEDAKNVFSSFLQSSYYKAVEVN